MNVLPLFIDDWLSSPRIEAMDAAEERGYMRLLMRGAKNDGWLPADPGQLAIWSKLGPQWNRPTQDRHYRIKGVTSGQKLLACFVQQSGKLFNERLTEVCEEFKRRQAHAAKAAQSRWAKSDNDLNGGPSSSGSPCSGISSGNAQTDAQSKPNGCIGYASHSHSHSHTEAVSPIVDSPVSVPVGEIINKPREKRTQETSRTIVDARAQEAQILRASLPDFETWWDGWSQVRGTNHRQQAFVAFVEVVPMARLPDCFACTASYLASLDNPAKGYNPENFLREQSRDGFQARWPPKRGSPGEERRREATRKFHDRMREEMRQEHGTRKIQSA